MALELAVEDPRTEDVQALLARHLAFAHATSPACHAHALPTDGLVDPAVTFVTCRDDGVLLGVGAIKRLEPAFAELKSMHVAEVARGRGVGRAILEHLLGIAIVRGYRRVSLETGTQDAFAPARALYVSAGFVACPPFAGYTASPYSTCLTRTLAPEPVREPT